MKARGNQKGFTLLELMIVIAILGILAAIAYPSFQYTLATNRAKLGESEINKALAYGRSEAISRNRYIGICPTEGKDSNLCASSPNSCPSALDSAPGCSWSNGFMAYLDNNFDYQFDPKVDEIIQHFYIRETQLIITLDTPSLTWKAGGLALHPANKSLNNHVITIIPSNNPSDQRYARYCTIAPTGKTICSNKEEKEKK